MRETCPLSGIRSCPLFGSCKCIASTGIAVGTATVVRYSGDVRYWECPLSEVPLYRACVEETLHEQAMSVRSM